MIRINELSCWSLQTDETVINLRPLAPRSPFCCAPLRAHLMELLQRNANVNKQYLYLNAATMAPSISIKALTPETVCLTLY